MKKFLLLIALFVLSSTVVISCNKEVKNCFDLASKADAAGLIYTTNPTTANCQAYKTALKNFLDCKYITAQEKAAYQPIFDQLIC